MRNKLVGIYLSALTVGFIVSGWLSFHNGWTYQQVAWSFLLSSAITNTLLLLSVTIYRTAQGKWLSIVGFAVKLFLVLSLHLVVGILSSYFLQMEPQLYFGPNGFIHHFGWDLIAHLVNHYWPLMTCLLAVKARMFLLTKAAILEGTGIQTEAFMILPLGLVSSLVFLCIRDFYPQLEPHTTALVVFLGLFFSPWHFLMPKSRHALIRDQEPHFAPRPKVPNEFTERGHPLLGFLMMTPAILFGGIFLTSPAASLRNFKIDFFFFDPIEIFPVLRELIGFSVTALVLSIFFLVGVNLGFSAYRWRIDSQAVRFKARVFLMGIGKILRQFNFKKGIDFSLQWEEPLAHYKDVQSELVLHNANSSGDDEPTYCEYLVKLVHKTNRARDVVLYRAYFEEGLNARAEEWRRVLR
ncbi:MAG: hypothetical protein WCH11_00890 [Bdellovibrio sp.]